MKIKQILAMVLALLMVVSMAACSRSTSPSSDNQTTTQNPDNTSTGEQAGSLPDYLNVGELPLVDEKITLKVAVYCHDNTQNPEETWQYKFLEDVVGVDIELVNHFYNATRAESISLMFADGDLPDLMIGFGLDTVQLTQYGANDGMLLDLAPYLNNENAPNIMKLAEKDPAWMNALTNNEGQVFSLGGYKELQYSKYADCYRMYYNWDVMEAAGITECPETLDEFLTMLRTIKAEFPQMYPFGGNYARYNATYLIMNALGFNKTLTSSDQRSHETDIGLRNGEVTLFSYDKEILPAYLEFMHTLYEEGLMEPDYYTLDKDTTKAHLTSGMYAVFSEVPGLYGGNEFGQQWWGGIPMTSEYNSTPFYPSTKTYSIGNWCISADTQYPELCVALADLFYRNDQIGQMMNRGPSINQAEEYGLGITTGWHYDTNDARFVYGDFEAVKDDYTDENYWRFEKITMWMDGTFYIEGLDAVSDENGESRIEDLITGITDVNESAKIRRELPDFNDSFSKQFNYVAQNCWNLYMTDEVTPSTCYFDTDTTSRLSDLKTLLDDYASQSLAEFITGRKEINEANLAAYFAEMENLGAEEYVQIYADYWAEANG